ncbi:MAG: dihydroorotase [Rhodospirillales bacterium]|nr:dihydroorotase [Rhodospirillales bacterium]
MTQFTLPKWYDLHMHMRQEELLTPLVQAQISMGCAGVLAMPNTRPPTAVVHAKDETDGMQSIENYAAAIRAAGGDAFSTLIVPLYLTRAATPEMIAEGAQSGQLKACKYYPPHGTTNADFGAPLETFIENGVFAAMEKHGIVLCIHGEEHGLCAEHYFDRHINAETLFYRDHMPKLAGTFPNLKIVCEHITTKAAADFVHSHGPNVAATITPQHLLYTVGTLIQGLKYHLFCLPVVKFEDDRTALRVAATAPDNTKFFAGTDSAPHTKKATECGCAAGCFTGGVAPQLYAQAFEESGIDLSGTDGQERFKRFLCLNGADFYNLPVPEETFTLTKEPQKIDILNTPAGPITPLPAGMNPLHSEKGTVLPWNLS